MRTELVNGTIQSADPNSSNTLRDAEKRRKHTVSRRRARFHLSEMQRVSGDYRVLIRPFGD